MSTAPEAAAPDTASVDLRLLRLLQLASPALPVGAYAYSHGLEHVVAAGRVHDAASCRHWLDGLLRRGIGRLDLPVLHRLQAALAADKPAAARAWDHWLLAARESAELQAEDRALGGALRRLLPTLEVPVELLPAAPSQAFALAVAGQHFGIAPHRLCLAYAWSWLENQVQAAVKLVPLGQSQGQRLLFELAGTLPALARAAAACADADIGGGVPALALASARHETQYVRLFRS